jgi:hypothetical protein
VRSFSRRWYRKNADSNGCSGRVISGGRERTSPAEMWKEAWGAVVCVTCGVFWEMGAGVGSFVVEGAAAVEACRAVVVVVVVVLVAVVVVRLRQDVQMGIVGARPAARRCQWRTHDEMEDVEGSPSRETLRLAPLSPRVILGRVEGVGSKLDASDGACSKKFGHEIDASRNAKPLGLRPAWGSDISCGLETET